MQELWSEFYNTIQELNTKECDPRKFETKAKGWVTLFISIHQKKDATPYMHAMTHYILGNIVQFTQQGLEKLNDISTKYFRGHQTTRNMKQ